MNSYRPTISCSFQKKISIRLFFAFLICLSGFLFAQSPVKFNHLSVEDGLSQSSVLSIAQDQSGFLWFGCSYGLNRYDGKNFKIYHSSQDNVQSISSDNSIKVFRGLKNQIWVLSYSGLDYYNQRQDNFTRVIKKEGLKYFYQEKNGRIWLGTSDGLNFSDNKAKPDFKLFPLLKNNKGLIINCIYQDQKSKLWVGSNKGLFCIDNKLITHFKNFKGSAEEITISAISQDKQQNLWLGTIGKGIFVWNPSTKSLVKHFTQNIANKQSLANNDVFKIIYTKMN